MNANTLGRDLRLSVAEGGLATVMGTLLSGVFLTGFAYSLHATRLQIGILFALPALCGVAQLAGSFLIERWQGVRRLCLWATLLSRLLYFPLVALPLLTPGLAARDRVWCVVAILLASNVLGAMGGVAWLSWIRALVPADHRIEFFGRRNLVNVGLSFSMCLAGGFIVDAGGASESARVMGFSLVFGIAMTCGLVSWLLLSSISNVPDEPTPRETPFSSIMVEPLRESNFRRLIAFYTVWTLAVNIAAPFIPIFFLQKLGLPFWFAIVLNTVASLTGMIANNFWTSLATRCGMKPVVVIATLGEALLPLALVFVRPEWSWALLPIHLTGFFNTPHAIGPDHFVLKLAPERNASSYMAVFRSFIGPATAIAAIFGGWLAGVLMGSNFGIGPVQIGGLQFVFLLSFVGRLVSLALLHRVYEPGAVSVTAMMSGAWMRLSARPVIVSSASTSATPFATSEA